MTTNSDHHQQQSSSSSSLGGMGMGISLLPLELLFEIFFRLALPELLRLRSVSKPLRTLLSADDFRRLYHLRSSNNSASLFILKKRPPRTSLLLALTPQSARWFRIPLPALPHEDLYLLAVSGPFFLFASNARHQLLALNLSTGQIHRLPPGPLGPRSTSSWRRSGIKLLGADGGGFRFLFADLFRSRPAVFEYRSESGAWQVHCATTTDDYDAAGAGAGAADSDVVVLDVVHFGNESVVLSWDGGRGGPVAHRPRFPPGLAGGPLVGFTTTDRFHVYGDGNVAVVRSRAGEEARTRVVSGVELLAMRRGRGGEWEWQPVAAAPPEVVAQAAARPYGVMMGCLVEREGVVRLVLVGNCRGSWAISRLSYDRPSGKWAAVHVPDCGTKGLNMAGIAVSSTFSRLWPTSAHYNHHHYDQPVSTL